MKLPKGMGAFKVSNYEFLRELPEDNPQSPATELLRIRVKKNITKQDSKFIAIPETDLIGKIRQAENEYIGEGLTEEGALESCIEKIKDMPFSEIFPKKKSE